MIENTWEPLQFIFFQHVGLVGDHPHGILAISDDQSRAFLSRGLPRNHSRNIFVNGLYMVNILLIYCYYTVNRWLMILNNMVVSYHW